MSKKPRGKHQCAEKSLEKFLNKINNIDDIKKIILGTAVNTRHSFSPGDFRFKKITKSGLLYQAYTQNGIRDIYLVCESGKKKSTRKKIDSISKEA